jgi:hypothetical protein
MDIDEPADLPSDDDAAFVWLQAAVQDILGTQASHRCRDEGTITPVPASRALSHPLRTPGYGFAAGTSTSL